MLANRKRQRTPRNGMKCEVARNMGIGKEEKNWQINISPTGYRPKPIDGPSCIPNCCNHDVEPAGPAPSTVVAFDVGSNSGNRSIEVTEVGGIPGVFVVE